MSPTRSSVRTLALSGHAPGLTMISILSPCPGIKRSALLHLHIKHNVYIISFNLLSLLLIAIFLSEPGLICLIGAKNDGSGGDNWS